MKVIYLYPSRFWPGRFWIKTCGLTGDWGTMPIGEPQQWAFIPQGFEEYLPFRSEAAATEYATRLAQELAQRWGLALVETTYQGQQAWRLGPERSGGGEMVGSRGAEVQGR